MRPGQQNYAPRREPGGDGEVERRALAEVELERRRLLRDGDPGQAEHDRFERRGDGPGVGDVVTQVRAMVDPGSSAGAKLAM